MSVISFAGLPAVERRAVTRLVLAASLALAACAVCAQQPRADQVPPPQDTPYPGTIAIHVDASDTLQGIFRVHETIPVKAGALTLLYPQWIPGSHSPSGPIAMLAGLKVKADGKPLAWKRDKYNVYAFHLDVPAGVSSIDADFQYLSPRRGGFEITDRMMDMEWSSMALYPAGHFSRGITFAPSVTLAHGWQLGTALETSSQSGDTTTFKPVTFNNLVDSPIYAGKYFKRIDLDPGAKAPVHMSIVADAPKYLEIKPEQIKPFRNLVQQMYKMYGAHHYDHYDFLVSLSDKMSGNGLEHHRSSEDGTSADFFTEWKKNVAARDLFSHEFNHSWNGKYRRGADLYTPTFNVPMGDSLLWVYEGQTQFWGQVMAARSGLWNAEHTRDTLAYVAATYDRGRPGLASWRNVQDTTNDPVIAKRAPLPYRNYQSSEDYYSAGEMIWLDVDGKLRELSHGKRSIDDFARAFFGMDNGQWNVNTYTFDDVVRTLNGVAPFDWAGYLRTRLDGHGPLTGGIESHGWKLVYTDQPSDAVKAAEKRRHQADFTYSLGLSIGNDGSIADVLWDGPAFKAGVAPGMSVIAVNGHDYDADDLKDAITAAAKDNNATIELLVKNFDEYQTVRIAYHDGLKYPHLVRDTSKPDTLAELLKPL